MLTVLVFWSWALLLPWLPPFVSEPQIVPLAQHLLYGPLDICLDLLPAAPPPSMQKRDAQHMLLQHRGARTDSYRAILVAIVSQNVFVLVFMGYRTIIARYVAKWGIAQMCLCQTKYQGGVSHHFGGVQTSLKGYRAIWGIPAIVSQHRAIWGH